MHHAHSQADAAGPWSSSVHPTFITPWTDSSAAHAVEPDFHLPAIYNVATVPPGPLKVRTFSDDTLFYMFYSYPRDALQELAAQELYAPPPLPSIPQLTLCSYARSWRFHKEQRVWLTKDGSAQASSKVPGGETGAWVVFDPEAWARERKEATVLWADLEEKTHAAFPPMTTLPQALAALQQQGAPAPPQASQAVPQGAQRYAAL